MKIVINSCYGGFGLSPQAIKWLYDKNSPIIRTVPIREYYGDNANGIESLVQALSVWKSYKNGIQFTNITRKTFEVLTDDESCVVVYDKYDTADRTHPDLIGCVEVLGGLANGPHAELKIVEVPDDVKWEIEDYDGIESVAEVHRVWE